MNTAAICYFYCKIKFISFKMVPSIKISMHHSWN